MKSVVLSAFDQALLCRRSITETVFDELKTFARLSTLAIAHLLTLLVLAKAIRLSPEVTECRLSHFCKIKALGNDCK